MADNLLSLYLDYLFMYIPINWNSNYLYIFPLRRINDESLPRTKLHPESYKRLGTLVIGFLLPSALCLLRLGVSCGDVLHRMVVSRGIRICMRILRTLVLRGSSDIHYDMYHSEYEKDECQRTIMVSDPSNI